MRVLYIADPLIIGGATRSLVDVVTTIQSQGVECIVCINDDNALSKELNDYHIPYITSGHRAVMDVRPKDIWKRPILFMLKAVKYYISIPIAIHNIESKIDMSALDLIHTNSVRSDIGMHLAKKYGIPHVAHIREFGEEDFNCCVYRLKYTQFINRYTTAVIAISQAVKNNWVEKGVDEKKITVIYNGVNDNSIIPVSRDTLHNGKIMKLVTVGGICEPKGQLQIIEAIGILPEDIKKNITLDLIGWGDPDYIELIERRIDELGLSKKVNIIGAKKGVGELLKNYNVGILCSKSEGFGRVTAEYMHARLGVIASNTGANPELIQDNISGLLYQYGNIQDLAQKIALYYRNRILLDDCATEGQKQAKEKFTKKRNADSILYLYEGLLKKVHDHPFYCEE